MSQIAEICGNFYFLTTSQPYDKIKKIFLVTSIVPQIRKKFVSKNTKFVLKRNFFERSLYAETIIECSADADNSVEDHR